MGQVHSRFVPRTGFPLGYGYPGGLIRLARERELRFRHLLLVHGHCHPLTGHLEKSLAHSWVGGQVREVYALARKVSISWSDVMTALPFITGGSALISLPPAPGSGPQPVMPDNIARSMARKLKNAVPNDRLLR